METPEREPPWRVFVSHTSELSEFPSEGSYVDAVVEAINARNHAPVDMAWFAARDQKPRAVCEEKIQNSHVYIAVLAFRYGTPVRDEPSVSYTELEFRSATDAGLPRLVFLLNEDAPATGIPPSQLYDDNRKRQADFRARVLEQGVTAVAFNDPRDLQLVVERALMDLETSYAESVARARVADRAQTEPVSTASAAGDSAGIRFDGDAVETHDGTEWRVIKLRGHVGDPGLAPGQQREEVVSSSQVETADRLIALEIGDPVVEPQVALSLYQLLLPTAAKELIESASNVIIEVDERTARYPWEMLAFRRRDQIETLSIGGGLLRRVAAREFRQRRVDKAAGNRALVIGDPPSALLPRVPGARFETERVADQMIREDFEVRAVISQAETDQDLGAEVWKALYADDYSILHIASHALEDPVDPSRSGLIVGTDAVLTAGELGRLPRPPQLVFLSYSHLGRPDVVNEATRPAPFHRLAATLSGQLIANGVSAVVAAGWSVDGAAAVDFATALYEHLLDGHTFADSVRNARLHVYHIHPASSTYGAFQCYGDPAFRLVDRTPPERPLSSQSELLARVTSLADEALRADPESLSWLAGRLASYVDVVPSEWLGPEVVHQMGRAYGHLGLLEEAVSWYERALEELDADAHRDSNTPDTDRLKRRGLKDEIRDQLAEWRLRLGAQLVSSADRRDRRRGEELMYLAGERFRQLLEIDENPYRHKLLGDYYRHRASQTATTSDRSHSLRRAEDHYATAGQLHHTRYGEREVDYIVLQATCALLQHQMTDQKVAEIRALLAAALEEATRRRRSDPSFANRMSVPHVQVVTALANQDLAARWYDVALAYLRELEEPHAKGEAQRELEYLDYVQRGLEARSDPQADQVRQIRDLLLELGAG